MSCVLLGTRNVLFCLLDVECAHVDIVFFRGPRWAFDVGTFRLKVSSSVFATLILLLPAVALKYNIYLKYAYYICM